MKIIQALVVLFAIVGCLALALGGFFLYTMSQSGDENFLTRLTKSSAAETTATANAPAAAAPAAATPVPVANSEYAAVIQQYQTPTPAPQAPAAAPGVPAAAPGAIAAAPASMTPLPKPVKTPGPDEGKIRNWPTGKKWVALTYDDGPHPEWTPKMIELLRSKNVKATFFLLGSQIERFPDIARDVAANGFEIGNHTMSHPDFNKSSMTPEKIREELEGTNELIATHATREKINVMRPPYGNTPKKLEEICKEMGLHIIAWNIDTDDWRSSTDAEKMADNIMKNIGDGAIILMHDKHEKTYDATAAVIDKIREQGYEFVTMSELLGLEQPGTQPAPAAAQPAAAGQPVAAPAQAVAPAPASSAALPPASAPAAPASEGGVLPVPGAAATPAPAGPSVDSSKITQPPPAR